MAPMQMIIDADSHITEPADMSTSRALEVPG